MAQARTESFPDSSPTDDMKDSNARLSAMLQGNKMAAEDPRTMADNTTLTEKIHSAISLLLGNRDAASEVVSEAFLKGVRHFSDPKNNPKNITNTQAWLFRAAINAGHDYRRSGWSKRSRSFYEDADVVDPRDPFAETITAEDRTRLTSALQDLHEEEREVFQMRTSGELMYDEIAEQRHVPSGTVKTQMRRAMIKLRKVLNQENSVA